MSDKPFDMDNTEACISVAKAISRDHTLWHDLEELVDVGGGTVIGVFDSSNRKGVSGGHGSYINSVGMFISGMSIQNDGIYVRYSKQHDKSLEDTVLEVNESEYQNRLEEIEEQSSGDDA
jgi:hypothetical protein